MNAIQNVPEHFAIIEAGKQQISESASRQRKQLADIRAAMSDMESDAKRIEEEIVSAERDAIRTLASKLLQAIGDDQGTSEPDAPAPIVSDQEKTLQTVADGMFPAPAPQPTN